MKAALSDKIAIFILAASSLSLAALFSFTSPSRAGSVGILAALILTFVAVCSLIYTLLGLVLRTLQHKLPQPIMSNLSRYGVSLFGSFSVLVMSVAGWSLPWVGGVSILFLIGCFFIVRKKQM